MNNDRRHVNLVGPTLLIGLGIILLLNNLGYLDWGLWDVLSLWPILLIAAGLELMVGRRSIWGSLIAALIVLALLGASIWFFGVAETEPRPGGAIVANGAFTETYEIDYPLEDAEAAEVTLLPAAAEVEVAGLVDSPNLAEGTIFLRRRSRIEADYEPGETVRLRLGDDESTNFVGPGRGNIWIVGLNDAIPLDLTVDLGVGEARLDLAELMLDGANVDFGVGQVEITLPTGTSSEINVDGGIGRIEITVPEESGVRLLFDTGIVTRNLPDGYTQSGDAYLSPAYETDETPVDLRIALGIGTVNVREIDD